MLKKLSIAALAGLVSLPAAAMAAPSVDQLQRQIDQLTRQLQALQQQMQELKTSTEDTASKVEDMSDSAEKWDLASRIQIFGDFRSRIDFNTADTPAHFTAMNVARGVEWFTDPQTLDPTNPGAIANNVHTVAGSQGATNGTAGLLYGFFLTDPSSPTAGNIAASAGAAGQTIGNILYGNPAAVTITTNAAGAITGVTVAAGSTELPQAQKTSNLINLMKQFSPAQRLALFQAMGYTPTAATRYDNDTMWTNRLRLGVRAKVMENVTFKGRLAMYKAWGMQNNPVDYTFQNGMGGGPYMLSSLSFDGSSTRQPVDNVLRVDRAYVNWTDIADLPIWFSIGRRPTTDGPPGHLRQGVDKRMATPTAFMDYPFDGLTIGYAYDGLFGMEDFPGRIRFCYGRGFDSGPTEDGNGLKDVDFAGISWDVYHKGDRFFAFQAFAAFDMFNVPDDITFPNPIEFAVWEDDATAYNPLDSSRDMVLNRTNLGNIYHTTAVYMDKYENLNYFVALGWSRTDPRTIDELGTGLLSSWNTSDANLQSEDGYAVYAGIRYDMPDRGLKLGLEYNYGSKYWIGFTPGHDDLYSSKLATRGHVFEGYLVYDLPAGDKISKYADFFIRLGYMHYKYDYTGSGFWLGEPMDIDELANDPLSAQFYTPIDTLDQVYLSLDAYF